MLTAAVRDLHRAHPSQFQTDVRTSAEALWENNPHITRLREGEPGVSLLDMHYPLIHQSSQRPYHFIHGYVQFLEQQIHLAIPVTRFQGDIHLAEAEKQLPAALAERGIPEGFWIVVADGKYDFTANEARTGTAPRTSSPFGESPRGLAGGRVARALQVCCSRGA
jgi:hypothetical protein